MTPRTPFQRNPLYYTTAGMEFLAAIGFFALLGWLAGRWLGRPGAGAGVGAVLGFAGGLYRLIVTAFKWQREMQREQQARWARWMAEDDDEES